MKMAVGASLTHVACFQPEELVEQLETTELWSMTPQEKLAIILALCHRVMGSYSVQDYMMECQKNASELW